MGISYVQNGNISGNALATSRTPVRPATLAVGDVCLCLAVSKNNDTHNWSGAGWTKLDQKNSGASFTASIGWMVSTGSDTNPTISWTNAAGCCAIIWEFSGNILLPIGVTGSNTGSGNPHSITGITTLASESAVVYMDTEDTNLSGLATPFGYTEHQDTGSGTPLIHTTVGSQLLTQPQAATNISVNGGSGNWILFQVEIQSQNPGQPTSKRLGGVKFATLRPGVW